MSQKFLKADTLDIHAGGRDLIFPHHENEIAQAEAFTGKPFTNYWMHHGLLTINGQKMSKSLGNFITIKDALSKYSPDSLKIFYLQAHYSSAIDFSDKNIKEAGAALERLSIFIDKAERIEDIAGKGKNILPSTQVFVDQVNNLENKFVEAMDDDFNTPQALSFLFEMVKEANKCEVLKDGDILYTARSIKKLSRIFGLSLKREEIDTELKTYIEKKIKEREDARKTKDFKRADDIREKLQEKGIVIEDCKEGTTWRKHTAHIEVNDERKP